MTTLLTLLALAAAATAPPGARPDDSPRGGAAAATARGEEEARQDRWDRAIGHYDEAIRLDPTFARAFRPGHWRSGRRATRRKRSET